MEFSLHIKTSCLLFILVALSLFPCRAEPTDTDIAQQLNAYLDGDDGCLDYLLTHQKQVLDALRQTKASAEEVNGHLVNLGHSNFKARRDATRALIEIGADAYPYVRTHLKANQEDPEIKNRCHRILDTPRPKQGNAFAIRRVKFFIACKDLPDTLISQFSLDYFDYFKELKPADKEDTSTAQFLKQFTTLDGCYDALKTRAKECTLNWFHLQIITQMYRVSFDQAIKDLIQPGEHFQSNLRVLLENYDKQVSPEQKTFVLDQLVAMPSTTRLTNPDTRALCKSFFKVNSIDFLNSTHPAMQVLGLHMYKGAWAPIRQRIEEIINANSGKTSFRRDMMILQDPFTVPDDEKEWLAQTLLNYPTFSAGSNVVSQLAMVESIPSDTILEAIKQEKRFPNRAGWALGLRKRKALPTDKLLEVLKASLSNIDTLREANEIADVFVTEMKTPPKIGEFDGLWLRHKEATPKASAAQLLNAGVRWRVTPKLVLPLLKPLLEERDVNAMFLPEGTFVHLLSSNDASVTVPVLTFIKDTLQRPPDKKTEHTRGLLLKAQTLQTVMERDPDSIPLVLKSSLSWFEGEHSELSLYYSVFRVGGHYQEDFQKIQPFFIRNRELFCNQLSKLQPGSTDFVRWFPCVALLATDAGTRDSYHTLLTRRFEEMLPLITKPEDLLVTVVVAQELGILNEQVNDAIIRLAAKPPDPYYGDILYLLDSRYADALPKLTANPDKALNSLKAALRINPRHRPAITALEHEFLNNNDQKLALEAGAWLNAVDSLPELPSLDAERLGFLLNPSDENSWYMESFLGSLERAADQRCVLKYICKDFDRFTEHIGIGNLTWKSPDNQKLVIKDVIRLLESSDKKLRKRAANFLASVSDEAIHYIPQIHAGLKKETQENILDSLVWALSNIGPAASEMEETVKAIELTKHPNRRLFCLANISRSEADRKKALGQLIEDFPGDDSDNLIRMIGLVSGQTDITQPFLVNLLNKAEKVDKDGTVRPLTESDVRELAWALERDPASEIVFQAYTSYLKRAATDPETMTEDTVGAVLWALDDQFPARLSDYNHLLNTLPIRMRASWAYWNIKNNKSAKTD